VELDGVLGHLVLGLVDNGNNILRVTRKEAGRGANDGESEWSM